MNDFEDMDKKINSICPWWSRSGKRSQASLRPVQKEGRGVVVMFNLDDIPERLKTILPSTKNLPKPPIEKGHGAVATAYVSHNDLLVLEGVIGEQEVLKLDLKLGAYDPDTTIVFAMIESGQNEEGKKMSQSSDLK